MLQKLHQILRAIRKQSHETKSRSLNQGESFVLKLIQETWGVQNRAENVYFMQQPGCEGAWIFVTAPNGTKRGAVNLTNTSAWYEDGTFSYEDLLRAVRGPE